MQFAVPRFDGRLFWRSLVLTVSRFDSPQIFNLTFEVAILCDCVIHFMIEFDQEVN